MLKEIPITVKPGDAIYIMLDGKTPEATPCEVVRILGKLIEIKTFDLMGNGTGHIMVSYFHSTIWTSEGKGVIPP